MIRVLLVWFLVSVPVAFVVGPWLRGLPQPAVLRVEDERPSVRSTHRR